MWTGYLSCFYVNKSKDISSILIDIVSSSHNQKTNPNYPGEEKVKVAKTILFFIPQGQANQIANKIDERNTIDENLYQLPIYSITLIIFINLSGSYLFLKKELKWSISV